MDTAQRRKTFGVDRGMLHFRQSIRCELARGPEKRTLKV